MSATLVLGQQGRIVIPAEIRASLGLTPGDELHVRIDGRRLVLERPSDAADALRALGRTLVPGGSLVDELLAERRAAAAADE